MIRECGAAFLDQSLNVILAHLSNPSLVLFGEVADCVSLQCVVDAVSSLCHAARIVILTVSEAGAAFKHSQRRWIVIGMFIPIGKLVVVARNRLQCSPSIVRIRYPVYPFITDRACNPSVSQLLGLPLCQKYYHLFLTSRRSKSRC